MFKKGTRSKNPETRISSCLEKELVVWVSLLSKNLKDFTVNLDGDVE
jgi:hypothetical protein